IATVNNLEIKIHTGSPGVGPGCKGTNCLRSVTPICVNRACNFLLLGGDSRAGLGRVAEATVTGQRADTIIVVHVDAARHHTVVLSIPRDLLVPIPGHGMNKINTAFSYGADLMVQTVERV